MERELCDLSHRVLQASDIGRLHGLMRVPVLAGDSFNLSSSILIRLAQLRRPLAIDVKYDVFAFYVPYRFCYGDDWITYVESGGKEAITFPTVGGAGMRMHALLSGKATYPKHIWHDYASIWNHWFRDPAWAEEDVDTPPSAQNKRFAGLRVAHLKTWGSAAGGLGDNADAEFDIDVSGASINLYDVQQGSSRLKTDSFRKYVSSRYTEIMESMSGSRQDPNIDKRPELVFQESSWLSGYDVNGTAGAELGASVGKAVGSVDLRIPRRFFPEHGTLYVLGVARIPPVWESSIQYLDDMNRPWEDMMPTGAMQQPPKELTLGDLWDGAGSGSLGHVPHFQWYREHPSFVNYDIYSSQAGWPYLSKPTTALDAKEAQSMADIFQSTPIREINVSCIHKIEAYRPLPDALDSIMGAM